MPAQHLDERVVIVGPAREPPRPADAIRCHQHAARPQHAQELAHRMLGVRRKLERLQARYGVKGLVGKGQLIGILEDQRAAVAPAGQPLPGSAQHTHRDIQSPYLPVKATVVQHRHGKAPRAGAHVQDQRTAHPTQPLQHRLGQAFAIPFPGDLFDAIIVSGRQVVEQRDHTPSQVRPFGDHQRPVEKRPQGDDAHAEQGPDHSTSSPLGFGAEWYSPSGSATRRDAIANAPREKRLARPPYIHSGCDPRK